MRSEIEHEVSEYFPFWKDLSATQQEDLLRYAKEHTFPRGRVLTPYNEDSESCMGFVAVEEGQLRAFMLSEEGKEVTLYRLFPFDICLFSAACVMKNIQFDIHLEVEKETKALIIPASLGNRLMQQSLAMADFTNQLMASRFSDVMWTLDQVLFKRMDSRIATLLLELSTIEETDVLSVTHEELANQLGTAREVVTRLLKYFQADGILVLSRGSIQILDKESLYKLAK